MSITRKLIMVLIGVSLVGFVAVSSFLSYSMNQNMMKDTERSALETISRTVQMFVVSTVKFHDEFSKASTQEEKNAVHQDWIRTIVAVDSAVIHDFGKDQTRVRT